MVAVGAATALVLVALSIVPFLNPVWVRFEQDRAGAGALTGYTSDQLDRVTGAILRDLVLGPPAFDVAIDGEAVLNDRERGHMTDVRGVFGAFGLAAAIALVALVGLWFRARRRGDLRGFWRSAGRGAAVLAIGIVGVGAVAFVAFDALFEVFHRIFFAGGSYAFDPRTERLVQLFPFQFWFDTTIALGVVIVVLGVATALVARRRAGPRVGEARTTATTALEGAR